MDNRAKLGIWTVFVVLAAVAAIWLFIGEDETDDPPAGGSTTPIAAGGDDEPAEPSSNGGQGKEDEGGNGGGDGGNSGPGGDEGGSPSGDPGGDGEDPNPPGPPIKPDDEPRDPDVPVGPSEDVAAVDATIRDYLLAIYGGDGEGACAQLSAAGLESARRKLGKAAPETKGSPCEQSILLYQGAYGDAIEDPKITAIVVRGDTATATGPLKEPARLSQGADGWLIDEYGQ